MTTTVLNNKKSLALQEKAVKLIPGMTQLLSKRPDRYSRGVWPTYFKEAKGVEVVDLDDNRYLDFSIGGIGATVLGYADEDVNKAVIDVINKGSASTLNPPEEVALAEKLLELHPWADMARFSRGGGEAMSMAVRIARVATGKDTVVFCGYHGWCDWYLAANLGKKDALDDQWIAGLNPNGVPKGLTGTAIPFYYNNIENFMRAIEQAGDDLAAIVMEPIRNYEPTQEFIDAIHKVAKEKKVPLIIDEITAAFRMNNGGAHLKLGFNPDIAVFSKALGNGFCSSAVIGKKWVMEYAQDAFITSTNWTERTGSVAALAMIEKFIRVDASTHMLAISDKVWDIWETLADKHGLKIHIGGFKPLIHFSFEENHSVNIAFFTQEMLKRGFLAGGGFYAMYAHTFEQVEKYGKAVDEVFAEISKLGKDVENHLEGLPAASGFGRVN
ncbi:aminotransferase class III-fold pyridoxal phosphate-dependent enzyme [bacterium]|nr:aminotransferase class III-fold pyridoxal phosphate-dependent enzyme [bacterium]